MSEVSDAASARYANQHLEQIVVETSETSSAPGRLRLHDKKEKAKPE